MAKKVYRSEPASPEIGYFVREGKECAHAGVEYQGGDRFTPFDSLSLELQNLHLPNLERREVLDLDEDPNVNAAFSSTPLEPEQVVEVISQEAEDPQAYNDVPY